MVGMAKRPPRAVIAANQKDKSGTFLRAWRKKRGFSQGGLAAEAGYSQGMISQWENGETTLNLEHLNALAGALEITVKELQFRDPAAEETVEDVFDGVPDNEKDRALDLLRTFQRTSKRND
jgi:transcriptional regulator with XRE-family HTH domain